MISRALRSTQRLGAPFRGSAALRASTGSAAQAPRNNETQLYAILASLGAAAIGTAVYFSQMTDLQSSTKKLEQFGTTSSSTTTVLCETIVPDVSLPAELHEQFNKFGKPQSEW